MSDTLYENYLGTQPYYDSIRIRKNRTYYQTFTAEATYTLTHVHLPITRESSSTDDAKYGVVTLYIQATDGDGLPTGAAMGTITILPSDLSYETYEWVEITLSEGVALTEGVVYAIVIDRADVETYNYYLGWYYTYNEIPTDYYTEGGFGDSVNGLWDVDDPDTSSDALFQTDNEEFLGEKYAEDYAPAEDDFYWFQTFTPENAHQITSVKVPLFRATEDATSAKVILELRAVGEGSLPTATILRSKEVDLSEIVGGDGAYYSLVYTEFVFSSGVTLSADVEYAIVVKTDTPEQVNWWYDKSQNFYTRGRGGYGYLSGGAEAWSLYSTNVDFLFAEYGVVVPTAVSYNFTADAILTDSPIPVELQYEFTYDAILRHTEFVRDRPETYDEDKLWDEENKTWYEPSHSIGSERMAQAGGRQRCQLVVISNQAQIYFRDLE